MPSDRGLRLAAVLAGTLAATPLWVGRFLPLMDLPQHLALATALIHAGDPAWPPSAAFEVQRLELTPYWAHYLALEGLGRLISVETAARVVLTLYALALPWAAMSLARALGAPPAAGLLAAPLALNANLYFGFIAYCWGVVVLLWALALLSRQMDAPRPARAGGIALLAAALFFTHVQAFAFLLLGAAVLAPLGGAPVWRRAWRAWPIAPAVLALLLPWLYLTTTARPGAERYFPALDAPRAAHEGIAARFRDFPSAVTGSYQDGTDVALLGAWAAAILAAYAWARRTGGAVPSRRALALLLAALACYYALPFSIQGQWNIGPRFAWVAAMLLPMLLAATPRWLPAAAVALSAATAANGAWQHVRFDREAGAFDRALLAVPPGARVLGIIDDPRGAVLERWPYLHFEQYVVVRRGALAAHSFAAHAPLPVRLRPEARLPAPGVWRPDEFRRETHGSAFDVFLVRDPESSSALDQRLGAGVAEVFREGAWRVYRRTI